MNDKKHKWLRLDADDGWQIVIPDFDSQPHATERKDGAEVAWMDCPCKPRMSVGEKIIVHNSFIDEERIQASLTHQQKEV